jgi:fluoroacetyl-CoA thioesterase
VVHNPSRLIAGPKEQIEMLDTLKPGISKTKRIDVDNTRTIEFMGEEGRVYATPALIGDIEMTCRELLLENLEPGEDSVGVRVVLDHMAATPAGAWVDIAVTVTAVEGRSVRFDVECKDALEKVAAGEHGRFVVDVQTTAVRLAKKREAIQKTS